MADVIPVPLADHDGLAVLVEVADTTADPTGREPAALGWSRRGGDATLEEGSTGRHRLEQTLENVCDVASKAFGKLRGQPLAPDEVTLEFGIKLTTKAEAYIASAGVETNFKVTLVWKPRPPADGAAA